MSLLFSTIVRVECVLDFFILFLNRILPHTDIVNDHSLISHIYCPTALNANINHDGLNSTLGTNWN